jgi:hypothetical protein
LSILTISIKIRTKGLHNIAMAKINQDLLPFYSVGFIDRLVIASIPGIHNTLDSSLNEGVSDGERPIVPDLSCHVQQEHMCPGGEIAKITRRTGTGLLH